MDTPVIIFGAKTLGRIAFDALHSNDRVVYGFLDDDATLHRTEIGDVLVLGHCQDPTYLRLLGDQCQPFVALDDLREAQSLTRLLIKEYKSMPVNVLHRTSYISSGAILRHGILIGANSTVGFGTEVAEHVRILSGVQIESDVEIGEFSYLGTGVVVGAKAKIGKGVYIGAGAVITSGVEIGDFAKIGPGSVVIRAVDEGESVFGVPAVKV